MVADRVLPVRTGSRYPVVVLMVVLSIAAVSVVSAQSRSVYGAGLDESAALVRLVNAGPTASSTLTPLRIGGVTLSAPRPGDVTAYRPLALDIYTISWAGKRREFQPESGCFYTVVIWAGGLAVLGDTKLDNPAKAQLALYNFASGKQVDLKTSDAATRIVGPVVTGNVASVLVNPVQVGMAVFAGSDRIADAGTIRLERGAAYSVFVTDGEPGSGQRAFVAKATVLAE